MTFGSLFAGIGGMDLGLERAGLQCKWQVEIDEYCRRVLAKHWPDVRRHDDIRTFPPAGDWTCDVIAGGFPCQDVSQAGRGVGLSGERSGLWFEFARTIRCLRPRFVLVENVPGLKHRGFSRVLSDLATLGYDAEWESISAAAFGAPHIRERLFIFAYTDNYAQPSMRQHDEAQGLSPSAGDVSDPEGGWQRQLRREQCEGTSKTRWDIYWETGESPVPRVANGVSNRLERLIGLGNAVVPQVSQWLGERISEYHRSLSG